MTFEQLLSALRELQWGRRSSSAETLPPSILTQVQAQLQWGRRSSSAETPGPAALMPRWPALLQWGRRSSSAETAAGRLRGAGRPFASMGPPIFVGGDNSLHAGGALQVVLQWGRRSSSAETQRPGPHA